MFLLSWVVEPFRERIEADTSYQEALVRANAEGGIWLVGGAVFRRLASLRTAP